jgi:hypothetical protein
MSHATLLDALDTGAVWSVARGLARNVATYKGHLASCDQTRRNDLDGRGNLSEEALAEFTRFFLATCVDQVTFMEGLMRPDTLRARILLWVEEQIRLDRSAAEIGRNPRGRALSRRPAARRRRWHRWHGRPPSPPRRLRSNRNSVRVCRWARHSQSCRAQRNSSAAKSRKASMETHKQRKKRVCS